ncbi:IPT/TIG domain-containing protein [Legionella tunisiensis]|uniref:IPT/TIG domain-containing protein n=1 Tax=Legionella tunisiensis TaxID=1034944 RepID=UPI0002EE1D9E|nr:IPT/TIG domain-containing protein [Legionella tunisiensis]
MLRYSNNIFLNRTLAFLCSVFMMTTVFAGTPLWTFEPLTATTMAVPANGTALVQYRVTNQSSKPHTLTMQPIRGITQITTGLNICGNPFVLRGKNSCILSLQINGSQLNSPVMDGPVVCQQGSTNQCYRPSSANILRITQAPPITDAVITVTGSPLTLTANGPTGQLTITNTTLEVVATNITSNFTGTALDGNVTETGNTCANVPPGGSCTLTYTPGNTVVPQTNFTIQGTNTNALTAAIAIQSGSTLTAINPTSGTASGGTGFTLTGTGLTGATSVTFDGIAATSVTVVNSTTVTGVTPAHTAGAVDVVINTPAGGATLANGYTYVATAVGQPAFGGTTACLNTGNNLIAATADNSTAIEWGGFGTAIGAGAQSDTDGASNTTAIVTALGSNGGTPYAAQLCNDFEVDSQGNTPCQAGNTCYDDWFLPAGNNLTPAGQLNCLFTNRAAIGGFASAGYWSSTEFSGDPTFAAWLQYFFNGSQLGDDKGFSLRVRCVRAFNP